MKVLPSLSNWFYSSDCFHWTILVNIFSKTHRWISCDLHSPLYLKETIPWPKPYKAKLIVVSLVLWNTGNESIELCNEIFQKITWIFIDHTVWTKIYFCVPVWDGYIIMGYFCTYERMIFVILFLNKKKFKCWPNY